MDWIWETLFFSLKAFNVFLITQILMPTRSAYLNMPVATALLLVVGAAYIVTGLRSAIFVARFVLFIALAEWWDRALITTYIMSSSVIIIGIIGVNVCTWAAQHSVAASSMLLVCDTFQTFPSFIYLVPVIMLFG